MTTAMTTRGEAQHQAAHDAGLQSATWRALGTSVQLVVTDHLDEAKAAVQRVLDEVDRVASRFREDSELRRLAPDTWTAASPLFVQALQAAKDAAEYTDGLVDPTLGDAMRDLGYDRTYAEITRVGPQVTVVRQASGWRGIEIDGDRVRAPHGLDLGATAKGLAADLAAEAATADSSSVLVSLGGDIAVVGDYPWPVLVTDTADPDDPDQTGQTITLYAGGLATSGTRSRRWTRGGTLMHHLLDPRTALPADSPWQTASVLAETCVLANVASTASIVLGDKAPGWLAERGFSARLVAADGRVTRVGSWPG